MNKKNKKSFQWLLRHTVTVFSCVAIIALGIVFLTYAAGTTTIGEDISTTNLTVSGNATTTGNLSVSGATNLATTTMATTTISALSSINTTIVYVKPGETIQTVINSITDAASTNPYTIMIPPGEYDEQLTLKQYVHLKGYGRDSTIISNASTVIILTADTSLSDLRVSYTGTGNAIDTEGGTGKQNIFISNVYIEALTGTGIQFRSHTSEWVTRIDNTFIKASSGINHLYSGYVILHNVDIQLVGQDLGVDHIGIAVRYGARYKIFGGSIYVSWDSSEKIQGDGDDVYGIYIPPSNEQTNVRVHLYNMDIMVTSGGNANINAIRAEGTQSTGRVRIYGGHMQQEAPNGTGYVFYQDNGNNIELYGTFWRSLPWDNVSFGTIKGFLMADATDYNYYSFLDGNLGIGNATPTYLLDVAGEGRFTSYVDASYFTATSTTATSTFYGSITGGNNLVLMETGDIGNANRAVDFADTDPRLRVYSADEAQANDYIEMYHNQSKGYINTPSVMYFDSGNSIIMDSASGQFYFRLAGGEAFTVFAKNDTDELKFSTRDTIGNQFVFTTNDNIGKDHDHDLQTNPTLFIQSDLDPSTSNNQWGSFVHDQENFIITTGANTGAGSSPTTDENAIVFAPRGTEQMRLDGSGNLGIGISSPVSTLHVPDGKYAQFEDNNAGAPPAADCDSDTERGRLSIDTTNNLLYICNGATRAWDSVSLTD